MKAGSVKSVDFYIEYLCRVNFTYEERKKFMNSNRWVLKYVLLDFMNMVERDIFRRL